MTKGLNLKAILEQYGEAAKQAAIDTVNNKADDLAAGSKQRAGSMFHGTGKLADSIQVIKPKRVSGLYHVRVICNAVNPLPIKHPGARGSKNTSSYAGGGYPYPRALEFSPKYNHPFFFQDYYEAKSALPDEVSEAIRKAVTNK